MASWVNWGKTVFLWMASRLGKVCFWCQIRCLSVARWYTCVSVFFPFFLHGWENVTDAIMHSSTRTVNSTRMANPSTAAEAAIGPHVKWRWKGAECERGGGGRGGTVAKQNRRNCRQFRCVQLVCICGVFFFLIISRKPVKWRRRLKCWSKWKIATIPCYSYCNHFNPSPVCVPGCVDTVKRCDASRCMTN